ncbi:MAG: EF-Tu/IF-2/RF-3 family GTPase, partial [Geminicoccaceae bacterium]|nr:EF-Tu/IF-2/RF-3 family GTPase [Geminicoccaceae bacterium]
SDVLEGFREAAALAVEAYPEPATRSYREGHMTPVFFGSALKDVGVRELLDGMALMAPPPRPQATTGRTIDPAEPRVAGFVFKVQANMDKNHRDRIAFLRLCSGRFRRGMKLKHARTGKPMALSNPIFFFAQERELAEEAFAGDIIGIPNHGTLRVGDTLSEGEDIRFTGIPDFAPEILSRVRLDDPLRAKQLQRALDDLAEEGLAQVFRPLDGRQRVVGVVGQLQLDVLSSRMSNEYEVRAGFEPAPYETVRWVTGDERTIQRFSQRHRSSLAEDRDGALVLLARNAWEIGRMGEDWPDLTFRSTRERS